MNFLCKWVVILLTLAMMIPEGVSQDITARLDLGRRDPKPTFYEFSPVDGGLVTFGPASTASSRFLGLVKYDSELNKDWKKTVVEQNGRKNVDFVTVIGENILVFLSEFFPKENVIKTYYYRYDLDGKEIVEEEILSVYPNQKEQKVDLQYVLSPNKKSLLCYKNLQNRRDSEQILYYLFDETGEYITNGEIGLKYPDNRFEVRSLRVSNKGNVFILGKFYRTQRIREAEDFQYLIYRYDVFEQTGEEYEIALGDRFITDLAFRLDREENMYIAGFYSNRSTDEIAGTLLQKITSNGDLLINTSQKFGPGFLQNYLSSGQINKGRELRDFYMDPIDGIVLRSDGGVLLIAEKFYLTQQSYRDIYGAWIERKVYHYEDVILTSVNQLGEIEWHAIVDKTQQSDNPASLSFFNMIGSNGTYIFYEYKPRRAGLNIYRNLVGIDGRVSERRPFIPDYRFGDEFYPRFAEQISNNEALMVYFQNRGRTLSVIKVRVD